MRLLTFSVFSIFLGAFGAFAKTTVYDVRADKIIPYSQLTKSIGFDHQVIVLGEYHYIESIQLAQANLIKQSAKSTPTVGWEFFNRVDRKKIASQFSLLTSGTINSTELLVEILGPGNSNSYAPIIDLAVTQKANFFATNFTRAQKKPVTKGGINKLDPKLLTSGYNSCSEDYYERFETAMGGPSHGFNIRNYFASQCLTDNILAQSVAEITSSAPIYLVVGSFHTDYDFGTIGQLNHRMFKTDVINIKFTIQADIGTKSLREYSNHSEYGGIAHFVIITD